MKPSDLKSAALLAEVLRIHRWAGSNEATAAKVFGLLHGIETVINPDDAEPMGISRETQDKFDDILDEIESTSQPANGMSLKARLRSDGIDEVDAKTLLDYYRLSGKFAEAIDMIAQADGSIYTSRTVNSDERNWRGGLNYFEICYDLPDGTHKTIGVFSPTVPRIGETVNLRDQQAMRVVDVVYLLCDDDEPTNGSTQYLLAHVIVEPAVDG